MNKPQKGFTLVEIAIVLVIIGLLLGGILKGQEMITQAKIKNVIADVTGVSAAMYGYQDRYRALPGDDKSADRWAGATKGNGNGVIEGTYNYTGATPPESLQFWDQLRRAGFVGGAGTDNPFNAVSGKMGVQTGDGSSPTPPGVLGKAGGQFFTGLILCSANLPDKIAISVDSQMDDGVGDAGSVRALKAGANPALPSGGNADPYTEDGVSTYVICRQM
ncbi:MAG TPA: prepilin-type N-terminal cleavage/methylation domain-containing protein [Burkholderiales bacterium]|nr:prepilin-type N-terminal cleavage/methylation domain-containing protein [Burkholderiales bacterium]